MFKKISFLVIVSLFLFAKDLHPTKVFKASGAVTDIFFKDNKIYLSTDASSIDIIDFKTKKIINSIKLPKIEDFMGDLIDRKIYSIDIYDKKILFVSEAQGGKREIYLYDKKLEKLITQDDKLIVSKAKFANDSYIVFSTLSNEFYYFDIKNKKTIYKIDIRAKDAEFNSKFSDMVLNEDRTKAVIADESGDLKIVDIKKGIIEGVLSGENLDNVFKVDWKKNFIISAGQDRRVGVYNILRKNSYHIQNSFLVYGAGLSIDANLGAYSSDEENNVVVFDINSKQKYFRLLDNKMTITAILFIDKDKIFVTSDSPIFNYYELK